jgi:hypothetical protein
MWKLTEFLIYAETCGQQAERSLVYCSLADLFRGIFIVMQAIKVSGDTAGKRSISTFI